KQDRIPAALDSLRLLCTLATEDRGPFDLALRALAAAGASGKAREALLEAASGPQVNPLVGGVWARSTADAGRWAECRRGLARLSDRARIWGEAAAEYVRALAGRRKVLRLRRFVGKERDRLRADPLAWGSVGNALESVRRYGSCVRW